MDLIDAEKLIFEIQDKQCGINRANCTKIKIKYNNTSITGMKHP